MPEAVTVFDLLRNERRLVLLAYLSETESATLSEAATHVAAVERDAPREAIDRETRRRTRLSLAQTHVPKLVEAGIVTYDERADRVRLVAERELLDPFRTGDRRRGLATAAAGVVGAAGSVAATLLGTVAPVVGVGQLALFAAVILLGVRDTIRRNPSSVRELAARLEIPVG